ncbi:MAG: glycine cleavage system protein H, partial [Phycisphaerales bacterium]|nr:glycine cleavage system protein H [Phycisphaerales bacterium]
MPSPADLRYTDTHEWVRVDKDIATIGVTQFAVDELTDITYVQMKKVGTKLAKGDQIGEVESVKATSDI